MNKLVQTVQDNRNRLVTGAVVVASGAGAASAQTTGTTSGIDYSSLVTPVQSGMVGAINASGPLLFGFVAVIGGFYFVWGRIRSLW